MINWIEALKGYGVKKSVLQGETLFYPEDEARAFYLLLNGGISLYKINLDGKETVIRKVNPGEIFAEVMVFTDTPSPVGAFADKDSSLVEFYKNEITAVLKENSELSMLFIKVLSERCIMLNEKIYQFSLQDVVSRLAGFFIRYIKENCIICKAEAGEPFDLVIPKKEIATMIGITSETLSRNFNKLHKMGVIKVFGKTVIVIDYKKLKQIARE
jgi:CRP/FNR family transcriptional regulator